jgi:hypothetical protein
MKWLLVLPGIAITLGAATVAFLFEFKHFYEFLLLGMLIVLIPFFPKEVFSAKRLLKAWALFFLVGIVVDLLLGLLIMKGWYYNYSAFWEYALLYVWAYPAGGLVLVLSYLLSKKLFNIRIREDQRFDIRIFWACSALLGIASLALIFAKDLFLFGARNYLFGTTVICFFIALSAPMAQLVGRNSWVREAVLNPLPILLATCTSTLVNLLLHELPNVAARQWMYVVTTGTFLDSPLLGVPLMLWLWWPFLTVGAVTIYYRTAKTSRAL